MEYKADGTFIADIELAFKRDERVMRFLTVKLDKHAIAYNDKKRAKAKEVAKEEAN